MNLPRFVAVSLLALTCHLASLAIAEEAGPAVPVLPSTQPLTMSGDIASELVDGVDRFLLGEIEKSVERGAAFWNRDTSWPQKYDS